jgi:phosphopantetheinyl transferase
MHGNLHSPVGLNDTTDAPDMALWLATPAARDYFDASSLTDADRARFQAHRNSRRQQEFQVSRALKSSVLTSSSAHSLSHSGGHAALLSASSALRVGVDLEVSQPRDVMRIARFAFHEQEVATLAAQSAGAQEELFYTLWTLKESLAKALQLSLVDALRQCVFTRTAAGWAGSAPTAMPWSVQVFRPRASFFLAAACVGASAPPPLQTWEWPPQRAAAWPIIACAAAPAGAAALPA